MQLGDGLLGFPDGLTPEAAIWVRTVQGAGGGVTPEALILADNFVRELRQTSLWGKVVWLAPLLGVGIGAARSPLIDLKGVGASANTGFTDAHFSQSTGIQGGTGRIFNMGFTPAAISNNTTLNGGYGFWPLADPPATLETMGCYGGTGTDRRYTMYLGGTAGGRRIFWWGNVGNTTGGNTVASATHYYCQRFSATSREFYEFGTLLATNTTSDSALDSNNRNIRWMGAHNYSASVDSEIPWTGRCGLCYVTDGSLSTPEILKFQDILIRRIMKPTGRI